MTNTLTPWYPPHIKPVRVGVYETRVIFMSEGENYQYWDGTQWGYCAHRPEYCTNFPSELQNRCWRGLAHPPEKSA